MNQELGFETMPFEIAPEFPAELFEEESEWGRRGGVAGGGGRYSRPGSRPGPRPGGAKRPPTPRPRPILRGPRGLRAVIREPYGIVSEPYPGEPEPSSSERVRWVQDCLNQASGLQLPVTGIMGPETRSAVRSFQRERGLRASGMVGPDTEEALRVACSGQSAEIGLGGEFQEEPEIGPLTATLRWQLNQAPSSPRNGTYLFTRAEARNVAGGGVYIAVDTNSNFPLLKVGESMSFRKNPGLDRRYVAMEKKRPGLQFYLATIFPGRVGGHGVGGVPNMIEKAIARLLLRAKKTLLEDDKPFVPTSVEGRVHVRNILPPNLLPLLQTAYRASGTDKPAKRLPITIPQNMPGTRPSGARQTLVLDPAIYPKWELPPW